MDHNTNDVGATLYRRVTADGPDDIRLIHLHPGALRDELQCTVVRADLSADPQYEALSYAWGEPVFDATIICNGDIPFKITSNLHRALVQLRDKEKPRVLWVDQISINQASTSDRTAQVSRMTRIYSKCQNAVVWLGHIPKVPKTFMEFIQILFGALRKQQDDGLILSDTFVSALQLSQMTAAQRKRYGLPNWTDPRWKLLLYIYGSTWLRRTWIVQEAALPRRVDVMIGPVAMGWGYFASILCYVESLKVPALNFATLGSWTAFLSLMTRRELTQKRNFSPLADLLFQHRRGKAKDPRDRIFGLMGLAAEREALPPADYDADVAKMFTKTTFDMFGRSGNLDILGLVGPARPDGPKDLPSWVPDYGNTRGPHPVTKRGTMQTSRNPQASAKFAASGHHRLKCGTDGQAFFVPAMIIAEIDDLAGCCAGQGDDEMNLQRVLPLVNLAYASRSIQSDLDAVNTSLSWDRLARSLIRRSPPIYRPTGESTEDALLLTHYEGQLEKTTDELRAVHALHTHALALWRIMTLGMGCAWLPLALPLITVYGALLWISSPMLKMLGYPSVSDLVTQGEMTREASERRLCTTSNGLIGLAPPDSALGDKVALLHGGRVPVVLRQDDDECFRFIGEAYVHGAMYGAMFDDEKGAMIKIR